MGEQRAGRAQDVGVDDEPRRAFTRARDHEACGPAQEREQHDQRAERGRVAAVLRRDAARDGAEQDREERRALDQRVTGRQLLAREVIRQDAVLDRAEQRRDHAEQAERYEQHPDRMIGKARNRDAAHRDLGELEAARHHGLVEPVGQLAAEAGQKEERRNERRGRKRDQLARMAAAELEQDEDDQRVLQKVVIERREELAPEQRRKAPGGHQRCGHATVSVRFFGLSLARFRAGWGPGGRSESAEMPQVARNQNHNPSP